MALAQLSDADLIVRVVAEDDRAAFAELLRRHQGKVCALLRKLTCGDEALADDLGQETFLRAYRGLRGYAGSARLSTWLYRIAYNVYLDAAARGGRDTAPAPPPGPPEGREEDEAARALLRHDLERAMAALRPPERAALALFYAADLSHEEAAEVLGCPLGSVKTHINRGRDKLRARLLSWGGRRSAGGT